MALTILSCVVFILIASIAANIEFGMRLASTGALNLNKKIKYIKSNFNKTSYLNQLYLFTRFFDVQPVIKVEMSNYHGELIYVLFISKITFIFGI